MRLVEGVVEAPIKKSIVRQRFEKEDGEAGERLVHRDLVTLRKRFYERFGPSPFDTGLKAVLKRLGMLLEGVHLKGLEGIEVGGR